MRYEVRPHSRFVDEYVIFDTYHGKSVVMPGTGKVPADDSLSLDKAADYAKMLNQQYHELFDHLPGKLKAIA